jgi:hypothetical protein
VGALSLSASAAAQETPQVDANHMRWENHDAVLTNAVAWQEERDGHWVTVVLLTDRPVPHEALVQGKAPGDLLTEANAQGLALAVMSGGVPMPQPGFDVAFRDGGAIRATIVNGAGGFEIQSQSATQIKGRAVYHPFTVGDRSESAWAVSFDAPVLRGSPERMAAEGEPLGAAGGQPGSDLLALQRAKLAMDHGALAAHASSELAAFLEDAGTRGKNLEMLKSMTPPQSRILGGLRTGDTARVYWAQQWPAGLDNRCVESLVLQDGKWRSTESQCQSE